MPCEPAWFCRGIYPPSVGESQLSWDHHISGTRFAGYASCRNHEGRLSLGRGPNVEQRPYPSRIAQELLTRGNAKLPLGLL